MADDAVAAAAAAASATAKANEDQAKKPDPKKQQQRKGILSRVWGVFSGRGDDFEKRLQYLSKEEAAAHARMKRRAAGWRKTARNIIVCSVVVEVAAVIYAIVTTRTVDLSWQMRAVRVLPMFLFPGLSFAIYSTLASFTRMRDRKDQKTLERLRAERQAKIDELKEKTNYYSTQQLIQRYDLDPAAKAAAASVLASKLGADSGLKVFLGDESKLNETSGKSNDVELVPSDGLRNRKQSNVRGQSPRSTAANQFSSGTVQEISSDGQQSPVQGQQLVEHYKGTGTNEGGWIARLAAMLVGEDPTQSYALICGNCRMHNGLARKEDFPYITYYCPHCHALNGHRQSEGHDPGSGFISGNTSSPATGSADVTPKISSTTSVASEAEVISQPVASLEQPSIGGIAREDSGGQS